MEAKELRIGNYLQKYSGNGFFEVTLEDLTIIELGQSKSNPIPLTEEWLLNFGFKEYMAPCDLRISISGGVLLQFHFGVNQLECWIGDEISRTDVLFVHQLQNLYFALTNQELTLNQ